MARETIVFFIAAIDILADEASGWSTFPDFVAHIQHLGKKLQEAGPKGKSLSMAETCRTRAQASTAQNWSLATSSSALSSLSRKNTLQHSLPRLKKVSLQ